MGLFDFIKKQFIDIIQWTEESDGVLVHRFPMNDFEIQNGASLTVRDSQQALFVDQGRIADLFAPGQYKLKTENLPLLTDLNHWDKLFESPFKSDVYFFSTRLQLDRKWGTSNPITLRDKEFGMVRLRAFGIYSFKIANPKVFYKEISGTREIYTVEDLDGQLRNQIVASISDMFGKSGISFLDFASNQILFSQQMKDTLTPLFERYGLALDSFVVQNVSLPEDLQQVLDKRIGVNIVGNMQSYTQLQVADAIPLAAQNEGGIAGVGAGIGAGLTVGQAMGQVTQGMIGGTAATPLAPAPSGSPTSGHEDVFETLEKLHALVGKGVLTPAEFETKKAELLSKIN